MSYLPPANPDAATKPQRDRAKGRRLAIASAIGVLVAVVAFAFIGIMTVGGGLLGMRNRFAALIMLASGVFVSAVASLTGFILSIMSLRVTIRGQGHPDDTGLAIIGITLSMFIFLFTTLVLVCFIMAIISAD